MSILDLQFIDQVQALYDRGYSQQEIADYLHTSRRQIRNALGDESVNAKGEMPCVEISPPEDPPPFSSPTRVSSADDTSSGFANLYVIGATALLIVGFAGGYHFADRQFLHRQAVNSSQPAESEDSSKL